MTLIDYKPKILVITPVRHIAGVAECLEATGQVTYLDDPTPAEVIACIHEYDAIYTNPNKSRVYFGRELMDAAKHLKVICTASTGTNHIDKAYAVERGLPILALTEERQVISRISSTAELAFTLTMASLRHIVRGHSAVMQGEWDYTRYIGRQMNCLTIGVIGYGRLGQMYAGYCKAFGSRVLVYDPYKTVEDTGLEQVKSLNELLPVADVVALHVHVTPETEGMINASILVHVKEDVLLVNTSRGDIVNEEDLVAFLRARPQARVATDVLRDEVRNRLSSPLLRYAAESAQVIITPHIGGMTREAQEIAYGHAAARLRDFFSPANERT
jgi:phosphoglycerate dehydrogenase-like enzyme